jgi:hypothetical protein
MKEILSDRKVMSKVVIKELENKKRLWVPEDLR